MTVSLVPQTEMMSHILSGSIHPKSTPLDICFSEICLTMAAGKAGKALIIGAVLNTNQTLDFVVQVQVNHVPYLLVNCTQWETFGETTKSQLKRCIFHWNIMETKTTKRSHSYNQRIHAETKRRLDIDKGTAAKITTVMVVCTVLKVRRKYFLKSNKATVMSWDSCIWINCV